MQTVRTWDIFCKVIDNFGDIGVCWRLASCLAARGQRVRLWVDDASALAWIAPQGAPAVQVCAWTAQSPQVGVDVPGDVVIEAFGCDGDAAWIAAHKTPDFIAAAAIKQGSSGELGIKNLLRGQHAPVWINLEYLSAEAFAQRNHALPSPVLSGPAVGLTKWFFYPGFTPTTGGLLREDGLLARQAQFKPLDWLNQLGLDGVQGGANTRLAHHGLASSCSDSASSNSASSNRASADRGLQTISLFCYEPQALNTWLQQLARGPQRTRLLVTHGRAAAAVQECLQAWQPASVACQTGLQPNEILREKLLLSEHLSLHYLSALTQHDYDHLLWSCQLNCVRGEDSLVRALWAGQPFVWHIYPQDDGAHAAKLDAFLDWLQAPADLRLFHYVWNGLSTQPLPAIDLVAWGAVAQVARQRLLEQTDAATQLMAFAEAKSARD